jgi:nucleotide-binding universal stress UspA family protein
MTLESARVIPMTSPMRRFVVGVDGSAAAEAAMRWAGPLAATSGAEILAVNAFDKPGPRLSPEELEQLVLDRKAAVADTWIRSAVDAGAAVKTSVHGGDPRDVVLKAADDEQANLVVLGRTGEGGGPGFLHLGSVVEYAAHHAHQPLAVIPPNASVPIQRIVVGVDGSPNSLRAVEWCAELAGVTNALVIAVAVKEPFMEWTTESSPDNWRRDVEKQIDEWVAPITAAGIEVEHVAQRDLHPADGLLGVSSARGGDVLVIGARGAGGFSGLRAGGVAMKVLHRASLPVVLVPPSD